MRRICGMHPSMVRDVCGLSQCPIRIAARVARGAVAQTASAPASIAIALMYNVAGFMASVMWEGAEALLERGFLAARIDARRAAPLCIRMAALCKCEPLHPLAALDELEHDAVLLESFGEIAPRLRLVDGCENGWTDAITPWLTPYNGLERWRERPEAALKTRQCTARINP